MCIVAMVSAEDPGLDFTTGGVQRDIINVYRFAHKIPVILVRF